MTDPAVFDTWNGVYFGDDGTHDNYPLIDSPGLHDLGFSSTLLNGGAGDGGAVTPQWADARAWVTSVDLVDPDPDAWMVRRDALAAATSIANSRFDEAPYVSTHRGVARTVFARVTKRMIPRDAVAVEDGVAVAQIAYAGMDPVIYGAEADIVFADGNDTQTAVHTDEGWVPSKRWNLVVPGPITNPVLSSDIDPTAVVRYIGSVASGHHLVVRMMPRRVGQIITKIVTTAELPDFATYGVGVNVYGDMDGGSGSNRPPQFFPITVGDAITLSSTAGGSAGATLTWRPGFD